MLTEIREPNFGLDLPGQWQQVGSAEPSTFVYRQVEDSATVTVMLLAVKPMFAIADPMRLLADYLHHRSRFEQGQDPALSQTEPLAQRKAESFEGSWDGVEAASGRRLRHRVVLSGNLLADFWYEASNLDETAFDEEADLVLGSATVSTE